MKIETLKSTYYLRGAHILRVFVLAENQMQVTNTLIGKDELHLYTDNEEEEQEVEIIQGYRYLSSIEEVSEGYYEVVLTDEAPIPQIVRYKILSEIEAYDKSNAVNSFTIDGKQMWLDKTTRVGLVNSIGIEQAAGRETTSLWFDAVQYEIPIPLALQMLSALELYALDCYNITQSHIATVKLLEDVEMLENYDYTTGYPEKLAFTINAE